MKVWTTSGLKSLAIIGLFFAIAAPSYALAAVQFTEVMYDAPGSDDGREWLEVTNTGSIGVNLSGYKLFEAGVNHSITFISGGTGTTTLAAGESAIVASNAQKFLADYPAYAGALFKSSFSLNNTGETLVLKDKTLAVVDSLSYSSSMGADGDGNSLHLQSGSWVPGAPNPGSSAPSKAIIKAAPATISPSATKAISKTSASKKYSSSSASPNTFTSSQQASPFMPGTPSVWIYALGLGALVILGVGAALYVKPLALLKASETGREASEFELE